MVKYTPTIVALIFASVPSLAIEDNKCSWSEGVITALPITTPDEDTAVLKALVLPSDISGASDMEVIVPSGRKVIFCFQLEKPASITELKAKINSTFSHVHMLEVIEDTDMYNISLTAS